MICTLDVVRGDVLLPPHGTTPDAVKSNKHLKKLSVHENIYSASFTIVKPANNLHAKISRMKQSWLCAKVANCACWQVDIRSGVLFKSNVLVKWQCLFSYCIFRI